MTVARSVADVLNDHVVFEVECLDRMYLNVYVPQLQYPAGLVGFVHRQLGWFNGLFYRDVEELLVERGITVDQVKTCSYTAL